MMIDHSAFAILQEAVGLVEEQERFFLPHFLLWAYGTCNNRAGPHLGGDIIRVENHHLNRRMGASNSNPRLTRGADSPTVSTPWREVFENAHIV